jgi:hypothetical protein
VCGYAVSLCSLYALCGYSVWVKVIQEMKKKKKKKEKEKRKKRETGRAH